jgi:hypothetical protein
MAIKELNLEGGTVSKSSKKRYLRFVLPIAGVVLLLLLGSLSYVGLVLVPDTKDFTASVEGAVAQAEEVQKAIEAEDIVKAKEETTKLKEELQDSKLKLRRFGFVRFIPLANGYYNDADHLLSAAIIAAEAGELGADGILPFADVLGLKGNEAKTTAKEKTQIIVKEVIPSLVPLADKLEVKLKLIDEEISQVDPYRYPEGLRVQGFSVRQGLIDAKENIDKAEEVMPDVKAALTIIPEVLGEPREKTYLILFQNDKELRGTGGFITSYAIAKLKSGKLVDIKSEDIYKLDRRFSSPEPPPEPLRKYLVLAHYPIRDTNLSPDYLVSAQKFESFYNTIPGVEKVDGIIALDTEFVRSLVEFTGPIKVEKLGETFSAENNEYGISDVVYKMELYSERVFRGKEDRKSFIGDLMNELIDRVLNSPPEKFESLAEALFNEANEKHLQIYLHNKDAQKLAEKFNFSGRIKEYEGDYLHVNNSNFAGLKANFFITQKIEQDIITSEDGTITKKVNVTLTNPSNQLVGWLNSNYRNFMRVYIPDGSRLVTQETQADFKEAKDLNKTVFESFSTTSPLTSSTSSFTYELPFKVKPGEEYKMLIQKQAGTESTEMVIRLNGKVIEEFDLTTDKEIKFKL